MAEKEVCEFCGKKKVVESTQFNGWYCKQCYKILIKASKEAIEEIENYKTN